MSEHSQYETIIFHFRLFLLFSFFNLSMKIEYNIITIFDHKHSQFTYTYFHMIHLTSPMKRKKLKHLFSVFFFVLSIFISDSTLILLFNFSLLDRVWKCSYFHSNIATTTNGIFSFFSKVASVYYYWDAEMISILCSETMRVYCISRKYNQKNINRL